jgi:TRAP-type C4-dicarboxylate transport system substrate-binding protein
MKASGCKITTLTGEQKQGFVKATQKVRNDFVAAFGKEGKTMIDLAEKYKK